MMVDLETSVLGVGIVFAVVAAAVYYAWASSSSSSSLLPPGPGSWPIIGHLHVLAKSNKTRPFHQTLHWLSQKYGPLFHLRLGSRLMVVVCSSVYAKEILSTQDKQFASRPRLAAGQHLGYDFTSMGWSPCNRVWRDIRKICATELFCPQKMEAWKPIREEATRAMVRHLLEITSGDGKIKMRPQLLRLVFDTVVQMVARKGYARAFDEYEAREFHHLIEKLVLLSGAFNIGDYFPLLRALDLQGCERDMKKLRQKVDNIMQRMVDDNRRRKGDQSMSEGVIDVLLQGPYSHNDTVIKSTAMALIVAGTDTTALTTEWALASMLQHPQIRAKAQQELDTHVGRHRLVEESDLSNLKYLEAIVKETLRLYPPGPVMLPHEAIETCVVEGGYHVPQGTTVLLNAWAIHRDPTVWPRPLEFDPERFIKSSLDVKGQDFRWVPFGAGRRSCPGMPLALCVVQFTLARLLQCFDWEDNQELIDMTEGIGLALSMAVPLEAALKPRLPLHLY